MPNSVFLHFSNLSFLSFFSCALETLFFHSPVTNKHDKHRPTLYKSTLFKLTLLRQKCLFGMFIQLYSIGNFFWEEFLGIVFKIFCWKRCFPCYTSFPWFLRKFSNTENSWLYTSYTIIVTSYKTMFLCHLYSYTVTMCFWAPSVCLCSCSSCLTRFLHRSWA